MKSILTLNKKLQQEVVPIIMGMSNPAIAKNSDTTFKECKFDLKKKIDFCYLKSIHCKKA